MNHLPTGRHFHVYINPERDMPADAFAVHGLSTEFLSDKPRFAEVAADFLAFIGDARLVIHNAAFDMKFLNAELRRAGHPTMPMSRALDTVAMARQKFPGAPVSLDALCRRWGIDNSNRTLHGALLDSELLAEVYLELIGGRQPDLVLVAEPARAAEGPPHHDLVDRIERLAEILADVDPLARRQAVGLDDQPERPGEHVFARLGDGVERPALAAE